MGTNYYSVSREIDLEKVGAEGGLGTFSEVRRANPDGVLHVGKSSLGWCFSLHVIPERGINTLTDWVEIFIDPERVLVDEYLDEVGLVEMMRIITARSKAEPVMWDADTMARNHAEPGPNNLVRHRLDLEERGQGCVRHGEGTWDYITGEFS